MANWTISETGRNTEHDPVYAVHCDGAYVTQDVLYPDALDWVAARIQDGDLVTEQHSRKAPLTQTYEQFMESQSADEKFLAGD